MDENDGLDETGRYPMKPNLPILGLLHSEPGNQKDSMDQGEEEDVGSPPGSPGSPGSPGYSPRGGASFLSRKAAARAEEHKLIHHAFKSAKLHQQTAKEALSKVPDEVLSGESHFDLAAFMRRIEDK